MLRVSPRVTDPVSSEGDACARAKFGSTRPIPGSGPVGAHRAPHTNFAVSLSRFAIVTAVSAGPESTPSGVSSSLLVEGVK